MNIRVDRLMILVTPRCKVIVGDGQLPILSCKFVLNTFNLDDAQKCFFFLNDTSALRFTPTHRANEVLFHPRFMRARMRLA